MRTHIFEDPPLDLKLIIVFQLFTVIFLTIPPLNTTIIRTILGIPMVLFVPGYVLIVALFPGKYDLDGIERLALSLGLSIAVVPLLGLGLNFTPWGIRFGPIIATLILFTLSLLIIANFRRLELKADERFGIPLKATIMSLKEEFQKPGDRIDRLLTIVLILSIIASLILLVYVIAAPKQGEKFTEFYILGPGGKASDYPRNASPAKPVNLIVGVVNHEYSIINYSLKVKIKNDTFLEQKIRLTHNQTLEEPVRFSINTTGSDMKLEFLLFREDNAEPYRETHLWINSENVSMNRTEGQFI